MEIESQVAPELRRVEDECAVRVLYACEVGQPRVRFCLDGQRFRRAVYLRSPARLASISLPETPLCPVETLNIFFRRWVENAF